MGLPLAQEEDSGLFVFNTQEEALSVMRQGGLLRAEAMKEVIPNGSALLSSDDYLIPNSLLSRFLEVEASQMHYHGQVSHHGRALATIAKI